MNDLRSRMELMTYEERLAMREPEPETVTCSVCWEDLTYGARFHCPRCHAVVCLEHIADLDAESGLDELVCETCKQQKEAV